MEASKDNKVDGEKELKDVLKVVRQRKIELTPFGESMTRHSLS